MSFKLLKEKLLALQTNIEEEKQKLGKRKKKLKSREKHINALRDKASGISNNNAHNKNGGSEYAESELTYFSDGDTEIASVNSISDDENDNVNAKTASYKPPMSHLGIPQNPF